MGSRVGAQVVAALADTILRHVRQIEARVYLQAEQAAVLEVVDAAREDIRELCAGKQQKEFRQHCLGAKKRYILMNVEVPGERDQY